MNNVEKVIKPHLVKPMLENIVFDKRQLPAPNTMINIKSEDMVDVRKISEEIVKVTVQRTLVVTPENIMRVAVAMSIKIPIDSIEFMKLQAPKEYIKNSQPVRILISYISSLITDLTMHTFLGPIVTPPNIQE